MTQPALIERITRSLAYMLRHQPEKFDLELDTQGFGELDDVVRALSDRLGEAIEPGDVEAAVTSGDRPRYEIQGTRIRALYGHSIPVEPGEAAQPPEFLFVGIDTRDVQRAQQFGLRGGRRRFLHLALSADDAREAGRRAARDYTILRVFALDAWEEGVNFYDRKTLYLAEHIPTEYLEVLERGTDGYEPRIEGRPEHRDERRGDERRGGRGDRHGERRDRPRGGDRPPRDHDRPRDAHREPMRDHEPSRAEDRPVDPERRRDDESSREWPREDRVREPRTFEQRTFEPRTFEPRPFEGGRDPELDRTPETERARVPEMARDELRPRREGRGERPPRSDRPQGDRPHGDRPPRDPSSDRPPSDRPPSDRQGDGDRGRRGPDRGDRRPERHGERPAHAGRGDFRGEPRDADRRDAPRRETAPPRPAPAARPETRGARPAPADDSSFGLGVFEEPKAEREPRRAAPARPSAPPPPPPAPSRVEDPLSDFGAGL